MGELLDPFVGDDGGRLRRIYEALLPLGDVSELFLDMCLIATNANEFSAAPTLVLHDLRELLSALRDVLDPGEPTGALPTGPRADLRGDLAAVLIQHGIADDEDVLDKLQQQLQPRTNEARQIRRICEALELDEEVSLRWAALQPHKRAHRRHLRVAQQDASYRTVVADAIDVLDAIASAWSRQWPRMAALIEDAAAAQTPSRDLAKRLAGTLPTNPPVQAALFERLGPEWLATLRKVGIVSNPPQALRSGGQVFAVPWPAGSFLARVATDAPADVAAAIEDLERTDNPLALEQIAHAAASMPIEDARPVLRWLAAAIEATDLPLRGRDVLPAVTHHPLDDPAVATLAQAALRPRPTGAVGMVPIVAADVHAQLAAAVAAGPDPAAAADLLASLLLEAATDHGLVDENQETGWWVRDLTPGAAPGNDARAAVGLALLAACERITDVGAALSALDELPVPLRHRLRLELVRRWILAGSASAGLAVHELTTASDLRVPAVDREWAMLAATAASGLSDDDRRAILNAIGIDPAAPPMAPPPPPAGTADDQRAWWPHRWLIRAVSAITLMPTPLQDRVQAAAPAGLDPAALRGWRVTSHRPPSIFDDAASPTSFADAIAVIARRLRELAADPATPMPEPSWPVPIGGVADYADGARSELATRAAADPVSAATAFHDLMTLPARATRGAVDGLHQAARQGQLVPWGDVAAFADTVVAAGLSAEWTGALHAGDAARAAADHSDLVLALADALADATRSPGETLALAVPVPTEEIPAITSGLQRLLAVADPVAWRRDTLAPRPDVPPRSIADLATEGLIRLLPAQHDNADHLLRHLLDAAVEQSAVRVALGYRLAALAAHHAHGVGDYIEQVLGPTPTAMLEDWDPALAAHLAGAPLQTEALPAVLPWYRAAADQLRPHDADDPDGRGSALLSHLARPVLAGQLATDDATVAALLHRGGGIPAGFVGGVIDELRLTDPVSLSMADRARALVEAACTATETDESAGRRVAAMLGVLADPDVTVTLGEQWVLDRLRWALERRVAPSGPWHVARLLCAQVSAGRSGAGEMCADLVRLLNPRDRDATAELIAAAAATKPEERWAADVVSVLSLHLGPARVAAAMSRADDAVDAPA